MWAGKWCIIYWVKMEIHREISTYFRLKHRCGKEVIFPYSVSKQKSRDLPPLVLPTTREEESGHKHAHGSMNTIDAYLIFLNCVCVRFP